MCSGGTEVISSYVNGHTRYKKIWLFNSSRRLLCTTNVTIDVILSCIDTQHYCNITPHAGDEEELYTIIVLGCIIT